MMRTVLYLKNCNTSKRVIKEVGIGKEFELRDVKENKLTADEIDQLAELAGSYEALFSRKARKYREYNLHLKNLTENDFKKYLNEDYTFLKHPTVIIDDKTFIGSHRNTVKELAYHMIYLITETQI